MVRVFSSSVRRAMLGTAAALLFGGLSACVQTHRQVYELPCSYEGVWMPDNSEAQNHNTVDMKLTARLFIYEAGGQWYLPVRKITFVRRPNVLGTWGRPPYTVTRESARDTQTYYLPITAAALLAVGVDLPVSVISSAVVCTAGGIYALLYPSQVFR